MCAAQAFHTHTPTMHRRRGAGKPSRSAPNPFDSNSVQSLIEQAEEAAAMFDLGTAIQKYNQALEIEPSNVQVLDDLAEILLEIHDFENAHKISFSTRLSE
jgi:thioredoxin-like negative regulator of GroEL